MDTKSRGRRGRLFCSQLTIVVLLLLTHVPAERHAAAAPHRCCDCRPQVTAGCVRTNAGWVRFCKHESGLQGCERVDCSYVPCSPPSPSASQCGDCIEDRLTGRSFRSCTARGYLPFTLPCWCNPCTVAKVEPPARPPSPSHLCYNRKTHRDLPH